MNKTIIQFIREQTCTTLCGVDDEGKPYCFTCFYAFDSEKGLIHFKSSPSSHHSSLMDSNPFLAGTILPDKLNTLFVKGVQFEAVVLNKEHPLTKQDASCYYKKHPMALAIAGEIRTIEINRIKMTDSSRVFGKKIMWSRSEKLEIPDSQ